MKEDATYLSQQLDPHPRVLHFLARERLDPNLRNATETSFGLKASILCSLDVHDRREDRGPKMSYNSHRV